MIYENLSFPVAPILFMSVGIATNNTIYFYQKLPSLYSVSRIPFGFIYRTILVYLLHPYARLIHAEKVSNQLSKINPPFCLEEKGQLVAVKLILRVNNGHGKSTLANFGVTNLE
mmetsp:Transcript_20529/g.44556  ORF Transcript_20529/g.44556 Transcript_20529/m.44556 type:complete len:114 (-) Transcript_20529:2292-2633(-)